VRHHEELQQKNRDKIYERHQLEIQALKDREDKINEKRQQIHLELEYKNKNLELIEYLKSSAVKEPLYGEHPFIRLV